MVFNNQFLAFNKFHFFHEWQKNIFALNYNWNNRLKTSTLIKEKGINWQFENPLKMTFKELNTVNRESAFQESRSQHLKNILLLLTIGGSANIIIWQLFDKSYLVANNPLLFWLRIITIVVFGVNILISFIRKTDNAHKQHLIAGFYLGTTFCMLLVIFTGASQSPYWFGLVFILIGWFVLAPFTYRELIIHSVIFFIMFMAGQFVQSNYKLVDYEVAKMIFLYSATLFIGFYAAFCRNRAEAESYISNQALKKKNTELNKFILVLDQAPGSVFMMDNKMNFEYINPCFTQLSGYTKEELLHRNINETLYKGKTPESRTEVIDTLRKGDSWHGELLTYHKSGSTYWANTIAAPYRDDAGNVGGYIIIQQDISDHKKMENALRESEELYRTLIEKSLNGVALTRNRSFFLINQAFCDIVGYSKEEMMEIQPESLLAPEDRERVLAIHDQRMRGELDTLNYTAKFVHKSGSLLTLELNSTTVQLNGENSSFVTLRDITEQQALKEELEQSVQKYRDLADLLPQTVYELDLNGKITFMNQAGMKAFGKLLPAGKYTPFDFIAPEDHQRLIQNIRKVEQDKVSSSGNEYMAVRADGSRYPIVIYGAPAYKNSMLTGTRGIIVDISERKAMEEALRESESKYKTLIENSQDGIFAIIGDKIHFVNHTFCKMLGYRPEALYSLPAISLIMPEDQQRGIEISLRRKNGDYTTVNEIFHFITKDGKVKEGDVFSSVVELNGQIVSYLTVHDLTETRRMQEQLKTAKNNLEMLNRDLEQRVIESSESLTEARTQLINLQKENLQSQFDVLKQQVNPHFLFNSLNVLTSLIKLEPDLAEKFSEHLSKVYRYVLENKDNELVNLNTELIFLDAYIFLLNIRFVNKLHVYIDIPEDKRSYQVIPLAMQLLIENAIKHNIMSKSNPLNIKIFIDGENFLNITNNLQERPSQILSTGVGLKNIQRRYLLLNNTEPVFEKTETHFIARVPLVKID